MRAHILTLALLVLLCAATLPKAGQTGGDKKGDPGANKEPKKVTAYTEVNGKNLFQWTELVKSKDRSMSEEALDAILIYPPDVAKQAVPALIAELKKHTNNAPIDMSIRTDIPAPLALILSSINNPDPKQVEDAVAVLRQMAKDSQIIVKVRAIQALGQLGPMARAAIPELVKEAGHTNSPSWALRNAAVIALGRVGYGDKELGHEDAVVKALVQGLSDPAFKVRLAALASLYGLKIADKKNLQKALQTMAAKDVDPMCQLRAHMAVYGLLDAPADKKKRAENIGHYLDNSDPLIRIEAAQALGHIGLEARDQVPRLLKTVRDTKTKDLIVMGWSMWALGQMGKAGEPALDELRKIEADTAIPEPVRIIAKEAIDGIMGVKSKKKDEPKKGAAKL